MNDYNDNPTGPNPSTCLEMAVSFLMVLMVSVLIWILVPILKPIVLAVLGAK